MAGKIRKRDTGEAGNKGQFGTVARCDAEVDVTDGRASAALADSISEGAISWLPYEIPALHEDIVRQNPGTEGKTFEQCFVDYFTEASSVLDEHDGNLEAVLEDPHDEEERQIARLPRIFGVDRVLPEPGTAANPLGERGEEWAVRDVGPHGIVISWTDEDGMFDGPSLTRTTATAKDAGARLAHARALRARAHALQQDMELLSAIRSRAKAPWSFLNPTRYQKQRHENVVPRVEMEIRQLSHQQEEYERARRIADRFPGMTDEQIDQKIRRPLVKDGTIHRFQFGHIKVAENLWHNPAQKGSQYLEAFTDDELNSTVRYTIEATRRAEADAERLADPDREEKIEQLRRRREYYSRCPGWPGGDLPPQWSNDTQQWKQLNATFEGGSHRTEMTVVPARPGGATAFPENDQFPLPGLDQ